MDNKLVKIESTNIVPFIYFIRNEKVMIDRDLANLYGVETRTLNQAVRRNIDRFPVDFMFELSNEEYNSLRSQFVISKNIKYYYYERISKNLLSSFFIFINFMLHYNN